MKKAIVIGAGIGGLAVSLRLRKAGYAVSIFEANNYPGGKLSDFEQDGYRFDVGPSLLTMPHFVDELFELFGLQAGEHFQYKKKEIACNYFWSDGMRFSVAADKDVFVQEAAKTFGVVPQKLEHYLKNSARKYELTAPVFLKKSLHKFSTYLSADTLKALVQTAGMDICSSLNAVNERTLGEPHLVQLFNRYATYNGSSPYSTPGIMSMIPHLELHYGTFFPKGGMASISKSMYDLAVLQGVRFHFSKNVGRILVEKNRVVGIQSDTVNHAADLVVSNMDIFPTYKRLMPNQPFPKKILEQERSSSALIFYWGVRGTFSELDLHNIFFTEDYPAEFECLFEKKTLHEDPTVYINITSKEEPKDAPEGGENWFVMINAPANYGQDWETMITAARNHIITKINKTLHIDLDSLIETESVLDPRSIESKTSSYRGALYGAASNNKFAAFLRHPNFSRKIDNLYFCGGSVHPGGGIPLVLLSAKIVGDLVPKEL